MDRRFFLGYCGVAGTSILFASDPKPKRSLSKNAYELIAAVQRHMFPEATGIPSAVSFGATQFLVEAIIHPLYDKDMRKYVIEGAEELQSRTKQKFLSFDEQEREESLRAYEKTAYGSGWLDRIMLLSLEGLLSDPIYGGNREKSGWKAVGTAGGDPEPQVRYAGL